MKVAVIISGQPRTYKETFKYFKRNILDVYDCDVYIHSWWSEDEANGKIYNPSNSRNYVKAPDKEFPENVVKLYTPKKLLIEQSLVMEESECRRSFAEKLKELYPGKHSDAYVELGETCALVHKFISVERAYNLVDSTIDYDWFVYWRFDALPHRFVNLYELTEKGMHCFTDEWGTFHNQPTHFSDVGWVVHKDYKNILEIMSFYTNLFSNKLVDALPPHMDRSYTGENIWAWNAFYKKVPIIKHPYEQFNLQLYRHGGYLPE